jgi:O-antigen ligase
VTLVVVPLLLWAGVRAHVRDPHALQVTASALFLGGALAALWGLLRWASGEGVAVDGVNRLVGPHFSPNHTALYLERTLLLGAGLAVASARPWRGWLVAGCGGVLLALVLTGSRGALVLGLPAGLLTFGWLALRRRPGLLRWTRLRKDRMRWILALLGLAVVGAALLLWERLLNVESALVRIDIWEATLRLWRAHLLVGVGPGSFFWTYPAYLPPGAPEPNQLHPHNLWLELAATWGILGFAWLGALLLTVRSQLAGVRATPAAVYWIATGAVAGLMAGIAHGQIDAFFLLADLAAWNTMAWALATSWGDS